jgi:hypothetical protein
MSGRIWLGLIMVAGSYGQLLIPQHLFDRPRYVLLGYALIPGNLLGFFAALFLLGIIVLGEGVCARFGGFSLLGWALADGRRLVRLLATAAAAGLTLEIGAQWLGRLWIYPYWTVWLYALVVLPGFVFYWVAIAESYLAAKAWLDSRVGSAALRLPRALPGVAGVVMLTVAAILYVRWFSLHGYAAAVSRPSEVAPPFEYCLVAFAGCWLVCESLLRPRSLLGNPVPMLAVLAASMPLSLIMETQNASHEFWRYTHWPWPSASLFGVPVSVLLTWPLQYVVFLTVAAVITPALAAPFFDGRRVS